MSRFQRIRAAVVEIVACFVLGQPKAHKATSQAVHHPAALGRSFCARTAALILAWALGLAFGLGVRPAHSV